jgi:hypothetical protein
MKTASFTASSFLANASLNTISAVPLISIEDDGESRPFVSRTEVSTLPERCVIRILNQHIEIPVVFKSWILENDSNDLSIASTNHLQQKNRTYL